MALVDLLAIVVVEGVTMVRERNPRRGVLGRAVSAVERRYRRVGFDGLTDNQKILLCVHDLIGADLAAYFTREAECLVEQLKDAELAEMDLPELDSLVEPLVQQDWAAAGLRRIGAAEAARAFERARVSGDWEQWSERFRRAEDIERLLLAFVQEHPEDFRPGRLR